MIIPAHDQLITIHLREHIEAHEPREADPHYHLFNEAKARIKANNLWKCAIEGCTFSNATNLELHHSRLEFSEQGGVDLDKFNKYYGLHLADTEAFQEYIESEGNLEVLCAVHHRTHLGIHVLPGPFWEALRVWKAGLPPPAESITGVP